MFVTWCSPTMAGVAGTARPSRIPRPLIPIVLVVVAAPRARRPLGSLPAPLLLRPVSVPLPVVILAAPGRLVFLLVNVLLFRTVSVIFVVFVMSIVRFVFIFSGSLFFVLLSGMAGARASAFPFFRAFRFGFAFWRVARTTAGVIIRVAGWRRALLIVWFIVIFMLWTRGVFTLTVSSRSFF